jgi:hypothetical protein
LFIAVVSKKQWPRIWVHAAFRIDQRVFIGEVSSAPAQQLGHQRRFARMRLAWQQQCATAAQNRARMHSAQCGQMLDYRFVERVDEMWNQGDRLACRDHMHITNQ